MSMQSQVFSNVDVGRQIEIFNDTILNVKSNLIRKEVINEVSDRERKQEKNRDKKDAYKR